ncbi:hypothetical protein PG990_008660 [Apiospora arundinis]
MAKILKGLVDLRAFVPGDRQSQSLFSFLQNQVVALFDSFKAPVPEEDKLESNNGLGVLLRVVRYLLSFQADNWLEPSEGKAPNPLLELAWADLERETVVDINQARIDVLKAFFPKQALTKQDLSRRWPATSLGTSPSGAASPFSSTALTPGPARPTVTLGWPTSPAKASREIGS